MPLFSVTLLDSFGVPHDFDERGIEAESEEDALKLALGGALGIPREQRLEAELENLRRRYDAQAERDGELGSEAVRVREQG